MLGRQEVQELLDRLATKSPKLVDDLVPNLLSLGEVLRVLRNLVRERLSIRDMRTVTESLADLAETTKDSEQLTELVRERLAPQITASARGADGTVSAIALDPTLDPGSLTNVSDRTGWRESEEETMGSSGVLPSRDGRRPQGASTKGPRQRASRWPYRRSNPTQVR